MDLFFSSMLILAGSPIADTLGIGLISEGNTYEALPPQHLAAKINSTIRALNHNQSVSSRIELAYGTRKDDILENHVTFNEFLSKDVAVIIYYGACKYERTMSHQAHALHIPFIFIPHDFCCSTTYITNYTTHLAPPCGFFEDAIVSLIKEQDWTDLVYFYDDDFDFNRLQHLLYTASSNGWEFSVHRVSSVRDVDLDTAFDKINRYVDHKWKNIVIATNSSLTIDILKKAKEKNMMTKKYKWLILTNELELPFINTGLLGKGTIVVLRPQFRKKEVGDIYHRGISENIVANELYLADAIGCVASVVRSLVKERGSTFQTKSLNQTRYRGYMGDVNLANGGYNQIQLDVFTIGRYLNRNELTKVGYWNTITGFSTTKPLFAQVFKGFNNATLNICAIEEPPFLYSRISNGSLEWYGFLYDVLVSLSVRLHFKFRIYRSPDGQYGAVKDDGTWTGIINELIHMRADIGLASLTVTSQREAVVDFTKPYMDYSTDILLQKPSTDAKRNADAFGFMQPFDTRVWAAILSAIFVIGFVMYLLNRLSPYGSYKCRSTNSRDFNFVNSMWFALGTFVQQGNDSHPRSPSSRLLSLFWWFFCIITVSTYTANMAAHLTVNRLEAPISSVEDLSKQTEIAYGTVLGTQLYSYFRGGKSSVYQQMWNYMNGSQTNFVTSSKQGIERVKDLEDRYAFLWDTPVLEYVTATNCDLMTVGQPFNFRSYGIALPQFAPYNDDLSIEILKMQESGKMEELKKKWWKRSKDCTDDVNETSSELTIQKMAGMFYFLAGGIVISCLAISVDFVFNRLSCKTMSQVFGKRNSFKVDTPS